MRLYKEFCFFNLIFAGYLDLPNCHQLTAILPNMPLNDSKVKTAECEIYSIVCHMGTMQSELYDALVKAGAPEENARAAAEAALAYPKSGDIATKSDFVRLEGKINLMQWMLGSVLAIVVFLLFHHLH